MAKVYVRITEEHDEEGQSLQILQTFESKPKLFDYIVFLDK